MSRGEDIGQDAMTAEDEDGGEEFVVISKAGHFVNLSTDSPRELQTDLLGNLVCREM